MTEPSNNRDRERELLGRIAALGEEIASYRGFVQDVSDLARELGLQNVHYDPQTVRRPLLTGAYDVPPASTYDIVCFSIIDWEFRWQRPQQVMSRFAADGHRVFYISISRYLPTSGERCAIRKLRENVWEVQLAIPDRLDVYGTEVTRELAFLLMDDLRALRNTFGIISAVSFVQLATWATLAYAAREEFGWRIVYDCMDEWDSFPGMSQALLASERRLLRDTDLLVVTGRKLLEKYSPLNANTVLARNAADFERFHSSERRAVLEDVPHPIVGYFGAIADWFDTELLVRAAIDRPSYSFVLLGGVFDVDVRQLQSLPNVHLLGQQPYELMPSFLAAFDVCTIPFKLNPITEATDPVKFYEYLSQGKPVVATRMHELEVYSELLYLADDATDFVKKLDVAVREQDQNLIERRIELARANTWGGRVSDIRAGIAHAHPRASVLIVTFGNLEVTRGCLESVFANTFYPNFEVIVVDNASTDGTPEYLRDLASRRANLTVILNDRNRGFAAANNQGLAVASGEYLVLLNNDTVVPPQWLSRLVRHLGRHDAGLVNAVTNFSGNESRIEVPYSDISGLAEFARARGREFDGEFFDIAVAAMYCVAMRREVFERVGVLDEKFGMGMFEDDDYAHRVRIAGYRVICAEDAFVHHYGQASFKKLTPEEYQKIWDANQSWYEEKWKTRWRAHVPRSWKRQTPSLPQRVEVEIFFTKLARQHELAESEKARFLESTHLRDEIVAREIHIDDLKRELFILQQAYEKILRSKAWKAVQLGWTVLKKIRPSPPAPPPEPEPEPLSADAFAPPAQSSTLDLELTDTAQEPLSGAIAPVRSETRIDVLCFPSIEWDFRFQRPQQLAAELGREGNRVFYVSHRLHPSGPPYSIREVAEGVHEVTLSGPARDVFVQTLTPKDVEELLGILDQLRQQQQLATTVIIAQLPFWGPLASGARERFGWPVVYDCMDLHSGFATAPRQLLDHEAELIRGADLVTVSSGELHDQLRHQSTNLLLLRNACDFERFNKAAWRSASPAPKGKRPLIGYYGAIAEWFDITLVASLAALHPEWDFVLIGSTAAADVSRLRKLRNVSLAGERPYAELPGWLERFDVAIIPFLITPLTRATNPVKAYEMLAAGKPVVSSPLPEMMNIAPLVRIASTVEEFEKQITEALAFDEEPAVVEKRISFARENTWSVRVARLRAAVNELFLAVRVVISGECKGAISDYPVLEVLPASTGIDRITAPGAEIVVFAADAAMIAGRGRLTALVRAFEEARLQVVHFDSLGQAPWGFVGVREAFERFAVGGSDVDALLRRIAELHATAESTG